MLKTKENPENNSYFKFSAYGLHGFANRSIARVRSKIYQRFAAAFKTGSDEKILDVGVSAEDHPASNFFEKKYPFTEKITAVGIEDYSDLERIYPGLKFVEADGRNLPFPAESFSVVFSHAVIEHTGSRENQARFIAELLRVSQRGIFITTPNRLHPVEFHTGFPLLHYLPQPITRFLYRILGKKFYASEENLNLLTKCGMKKMLKSLGITDYQIQNVFWLGFPSNILITIHKQK